MTARGQFDLVGHTLIRYDEIPLTAPQAVNNYIITPEAQEDEWTQSLMQMVGDWRATLRSTYIRWAMAINGLHVVAAKYKSETEPKKFTVSSLRADRSGIARQEIIAEYSFAQAAEAHLQIQPMLCAHGFIDIYAGLEELVFAFFRVYLLANPDHFIKGPEFVALRRLRKESSKSDEAMYAWKTALNERLDQWQRNKLYDGLDSVFLSFCRTARLQTPAAYTQTTVETWSQSIAGISLIRNLLIHGENVVPEELAEFCEKPYNIGFHFVRGKFLRLNIFHLQALENFCDQLLTGINHSLAERARPSLRREAIEKLRTPR